jgi:transcriptional regulator with XRE-family HTH domain
MAKSSNTCLLEEARLLRIRRTLGSEIRDRRRAAGLTQAELGRPLTRAYVGMLEAGLVLPSLPTLIVLAERLGMTPDELIRVVNAS